MTATGAPAAPLVEVRDLHVVYQRGAQPAVDGVDLTLGPGDGLLVTGERGSGKSSLLRALLGLVRFGGEVRVMSAYPGTPGATAHVGYGPQGRGFALGTTPRRLVALVAGLRTGVRAVHGIDAALRAAGIGADQADRHDSDVELLRRVSLACALVGDPSLVVLDDPWEFAETAAAVDAVRGRGGALIAACHDPGGLPALLGRTLTLVDGRAA